MQKLLEEHRRKFENFEVIDFVDTEAIAAMRAGTQSEVPVTVNWTWEYGEEVGELRRLYEKGKVNQWNAETDLDWDSPFSKDEWVLKREASMLAMICEMMGHDEATQKAAAFDELAFLLSQLLHGEQAALQICGQLTNVCDKMDQKWYASSQVIDEARHVEVISKFLSRKCGTIYPVAAPLKFLLDELLSAEGMQKKTLGMQTLFEGTAVGIMDILRTESENPFFRGMIRRVEQDESRHAAFGVLCMRRVVEEASTEEMHEMEDWSFRILESLNAFTTFEVLRTLGPKYGLDPEIAASVVLNSPDYVDANSQMYMHTVIPNLRRLGLITERTEQGWRNVGMMSDRSPSAVLDRTAEALAG